MSELTSLAYGEGLTEEQLETNQTFINLTYEYCDSDSSNYYIDAKALLKYLWNRGYKITKRET